MKKRIICFLLAVSMILAMCVLVSCDKSESNGKTSEAVSGEGSAAFEALPSTDYNGYTFRVLTRDDADQYWLPNDVCATEITSEVINDAVFKRTELVQNKFNIKIEQLMKTDYQDFARTAIQSNDDSFDVILMDSMRAGQLAVENLFINYSDVPYVDFSNSYWDKTTIDQLSIGGKSYFALGDINITDNNATWCVLFNKRLYADLDLGNAYECVNEGKWTIDVFYDICKNATGDLNGDSVIDYTNDRYGAVGQYECAPALMAAAGVTSVVKDSDDIPEFALDSAKANDVFAKVYKYMSDPDAMIRADDYSFADRWNVINVGTFMSGRAVYYMCPLTHAVQMREMVDDYGILPLPKYDEAQEKYYSAMQFNNATVYCVPKTCKDTDRVGLILEAMAAASTDTLKQAYYDITLQRRTTRDEESKEMIDIILENRIVDLSYVYDWNQLRQTIQDIVRGSSNTYASTIDSIKTPFITSMNKTIEKFAEE